MVHLHDLSLCASLCSGYFEFHGCSPEPAEDEFIMLNFASARRPTFEVVIIKPSSGGLSVHCWTSALVRRLMLMSVHWPFGDCM